MLFNPLRVTPKLCLPRTLFFAGALVLATEPAQWLYRSWSDPVWNSNGWIMGLVVLGLFGWSISSPRVKVSNQQNYAYLLLAASALVRLASQLLGINVIGAITLGCDVYALALLLGTHCRKRALAPGWLAVLFLLSLPLERVIQRLLGFALQQWSAGGACLFLELLGFEPVCDGISMRIATENVLVDLPCSGARGLLLIVSLYVVIACVNRPRALTAIIGIVITLAAAWFSNVARISLLAIGVVKQRGLSGFNVMEAPWHELIGLSTLTLGLLPVLIWANFVKSTPTVAKTSSALEKPKSETAKAWSYRAAPGFFVLSVIIVKLPTNAVDVSTAIEPVSLPRLIGNDIKTPLPLSEQETMYFTQYGGQAQRAVYGQHTLLTVTTSSPLRHLHAPDECLRAIGHDVRYLGIIEGKLPSALYRSRDANGQLWRITVTFVSEQGHQTTNVAHAVWLWMQNPQMVWTMVQRIRHWHADPALDEQFDRNITQILDLAVTPTSIHPKFINPVGATVL